MNTMSLVQRNPFHLVTSTILREEQAL